MADDMMADPTPKVYQYAFKRGLQPITHDRSGTIKFKDVFTLSNLPAAPPLPFGIFSSPHSLAPKTIGAKPLGILGNTTAGDCVIASKAHQAMVTNAAAGRYVEFSAANCLKDYYALTGGRDTGLDIDNTTKWAMTTGVQDATGTRHPIDAHMEIDHNNLSEMKAALSIFGTIELGLDLADDQEQQFTDGVPWTPVGTPNGGHDVPIVDWNHHDMPVVITWGGLQALSQSFLAARCSIAVASFTLDYLNAKGLSPQGYDAPRLRAMIAERQT